MSRSEVEILKIPESVKEDTFAYRSQVSKFLEDQTSPIAFRAYRVPMGVYEQRAAGKYMVRIRIGAGLVLPFQLVRIAELSKTYGNGILHITTRQDIQVHQVNIEDTPDVLERLLEVGLSPRGGGGNTVRNVTACPRAGVCPKEKFNVAPYAIATAEYLLQERSSFNLPRKYKIVFSGCAQDCAFASVADLGFFAHTQNGQNGFAVYAGGGLGPNPRVGVKIEDFIREDEIFEVAEAVKRFFDEHGDRSNKHRARLRYVLGRLGPEEFTNLYKAKRAELQKTGLAGNIPEIRDLTSLCQPAGTAEDAGTDLPLSNNSVMAEKNPGLFTIRLKLNYGDISADDMVKVGRIADRFGQGLVRTTQLQDILITTVPGQNIKGILSSLKDLSVDVLGNSQPKIVTCTGAATCKLGLCLSRNLTGAICEELQKKNVSTNGDGPVIRVSGCPNSCGNHYIADIGFEGKAKRVKGRLMPFYDVLAGAEIYEDQTRLAEKLGTVPAKRIPQLVAQALVAENLDKDTISNLVAQYSDVSSDISEDYYYDFGMTELFSLAGRGPGECGAGVMDVIRLDIDEAKDALKSTPTESENIYKAVIFAARALLVMFGLEPKKDREIFTAFGKYLIEPGWVKARTQQLFDNILDWRMGDIDSLDDLLGQVKDLTNRVDELFLSLDANLKFKAKPVAENDVVAGGETENHIIDLCGVKCPLNFVKAKLEIEKLKTGDILEVLLDEGEPVKNVSASFAEQGQEVMEVKNCGRYFCVKVRRRN